jgi:hypothetical protein
MRVLHSLTLHGDVTHNNNVCNTDPGVSLIHNNKKIRNGSTLSIQSIGKDDKALICKTTRSGCCKDPKRLGEWYNPNSSIIGTLGELNGGIFYRSRTNDGKVLLHKSSSDLPAPTGTYCCVVPDSQDNCGINQKLCAKIGERL